jgi:GNAT superfamily N-acetyltransferase
MNIEFSEFVISDDKALLQLDRICALLATTYWANERSRAAIEKSIQNSLCFGVYHHGEQIAFARCVSDFATVFWLADVIVDERYRGRGIGKAMVEAILSHESLQGVNGILATRDAHGLYRQFGFEPVEGRFMRRPAKKEDIALKNH